MPDFNRTLDDYRWLVGPSAAEYLEAAAADGRSVLDTITSLRRALTPSQASLVVEQLEFRQRARAKFAAATRMFFTRLGLQQATSGRIADYKARRFANDGPVADLCCGIGGDLTALAAARTVLGFDRDPIIALLADANCRAMGCASVAVDCRDVGELDVAQFAEWHIDPDRRPRLRRTSRPEMHEPDLSQLRRWLEQNEHAGIKLAPAAEIPADWSNQVELEWIGEQRECKQLVAWFGRLAGNPGKRCATVVSDTSGAALQFVGMPDTELVRTCHVQRFLYEPHATVLAARLGAALAARYGLWALISDGGYLTSEQSVVDPLLAAFEVLAEVPLDRRRLKALLRERQIGHLELKQRGVDVDLTQLGRSLRSSGAAQATLLLYKSGDKVRVVLARRLPSEAPRLGTARSRSGNDA